MPKNPEHNQLENEKMRENIFQTSNGYFDKLHNDILSKTEFLSNSSILDSENLKKNIYEVPGDYFELAQKRIVERIEKETPLKVIPLYKRNWFQYAAASIALIAVFVFGLKSDDGYSNIEFAGISDELIIEYLLDEGMSNLDILASIEEPTSIFDDIFNDEMNTLEYVDFDHPEIEYDFEYLEY